jgi:DNA polymerase-3 subunit epsilon
MENTTTTNQGAGSPRKQSVHEWAWKLTQQPDWCVLDTETTGMDLEDEIMEIAIVDGQSGQAAYTQLITPTRAECHPRALAVHGITPVMLRLAQAPTFALAWPGIHDALKRYSTIAVYNAAFDKRLLRQSAAAAGLALFLDENARELAALSKSSARFVLDHRWTCVMEEYAYGYGIPKAMSHSRGWVPLEQACRVQEVKTNDFQSHRALGDCQATRALIWALAAKHTPPVELTDEEVAHHLTQLEQLQRRREG